MSMIIWGATIIDGVADKAVEGQSIWIEGARIRAVGQRDDFGIPPGAHVIDARGKYVIPGLMNANVHLLNDVRLENLARYTDRYEELIVEAAQVALKGGLTTVFDTWGPRRHLIAVREQINAGKIPGSRILCAGNIVGFDGPISPDFFPKSAEVASSALARRINSVWAENVGRHLMWLTPEQVAQEVRAYVRRGIDFIKYASNDHVPGAFLAFSPTAQQRIAEEAHRAGITVQAHTMTVEGLRIAIEAGCELIQHANLTGPVPIPEATLELMAARKVGAVVFPFKERRLATILENASDARHTMWQASDVNARSLICSGAPLLLANDGALFAPEVVTDPAMSKRMSSYGALGEDNLFDLATGHFAWFDAMEEKQCPPMQMLKAATRNIAVAYGKAKDLGAILPGLIADLLVLEDNPLQSARNYRRIHTILKEGAIVDRDALPANPILTRPMDPAIADETGFRPFLSGSAFPLCSKCAFH